MSDPENGTRLYAVRVGTWTDDDGNTGSVYDVYIEFFPTVWERVYV